jgi:hypothetical protein
MSYRWISRRALEIRISVCPFTGLVWRCNRRTLLSTVNEATRQWNNRFPVVLHNQIQIRPQRLLQLLRRSRTLLCIHSYSLMVTCPPWWLNKWERWYKEVPGTKLFVYSKYQEGQAEAISKQLITNRRNHSVHNSAGGQKIARKDSRYRYSNRALNDR